MATTETRNIALSMFYRLYGILRQQKWYGQFNGITLTHLTGNDDFTNNPYPDNTYIYSEYRRPIVFIDDMNEVWPSGVKVYDMGNPLPTGMYSVNYLDGSISLVNPPSGAVTADLTLFNVKVVEGYPEPHILELTELPIIAAELLMDDGRDGLLGTFIQFRRQWFNLFVMARDPGQRQDLTGDLVKYTRFAPYVDYSTHKPLDENYSLDSSFSYADQFDNRMAVPNGVRADYLKHMAGGSDKEKFRSLIAFEVERLS